MEFEKIGEWGWVEPGTKVQDSKGNQYVVTKQNDAGFLALKNISGGESVGFESMAPINHEEFQAVE